MHMSYVRMGDRHIRCRCWSAEFEGARIIWLSARGSRIYGPLLTGDSCKRLEGYFGCSCHICMICMLVDAEMFMRRSQIPFL